MKKILLTLLAAVAFPWAANSWISASKSLAAVDSSLTVVARGYNSVSYQLTGTWSATVKFEGTVSGSNWITVYAVNQNGGSVDSVASVNGVYLLSGNGFLSIRARVSARSSGTIVAQATTNEGSGVVSLLNQSSAGASSNVAVTTSALPTGAATSANQTNGNQVAQLVDSAGSKIGSTSHAINVNITGGAASGAVAQGSTTSGQTGGLTQAATSTAAPTYTTGQTNPLSMTTGGALRVDASAASLTVGTHAVTQSGTWTLQPGNTANTTAWLVTGTGGTFPASQSGTWNDRMQDGSGNALASSATTPGGTEQALITRNIPSGTQAVSGTVTANAGTGTMAVSAASLPLPALAATSTKQSDGTQKTQIVDGSNNVIASTANALNVQCANCSGSGVSATDEAAFTAGSSTFAPGGGLYQVTQTSNPLTTGQQGAFQTTRFRAMHTTWRDSTGAVVGDATHPVQVSLANTGSNGTAVSVTCGNCSGSGVSAADEATFTAGSTSQALIGGFFQTTATSNALTTGQQGAFQVTANRALFVNPRNASGTEIATASNPYRTDPTGTTAQPVTDNGGSITVDAPVGTPAFVRLSDGAAAITTLPVSIATAPALVASSAVIGKVGIDQTTPGTTNLVALAANQSVNVAQINGVTALMGNGVTGTGSQRVTIASDNTAFSVNATATGAAAHGASVSGNPVLNGFEARSTDGTAVTSGQAVRGMATVDGKQVSMPYAIQGSRWSSAAASGGIVNTTGTTIKTAAGAGIRNCVTSIDIENGHATVSTEVVLRDGASGTVIKRWWAQAAGGGIAKQLPVPLCGTANTLLEVAAITTGSAIYVNAEGYTSAE